MILSTINQVFKSKTMSGGEGGLKVEATKSGIAVFIQENQFYT